MGPSYASVQLNYFLTLKQLKAQHGNTDISHKIFYLQVLNLQISQFRIIFRMGLHKSAWGTEVQWSRSKKYLTILAKSITLKIKGENNFVCKALQCNAVMHSQFFNEKSAKLKAAAINL